MSHETTHQVGAMSHVAHSQAPRCRQALRRALARKDSLAGS